MTESTRHHHQPIDDAGPPRRQSESDYSFTLARIAVAQICTRVGFKGSESPALEALTDIATRYLQTIAKVSAASANSNGRTQSCLSDVLVALEDIQGFPGSSVVKDLRRFVKYTDEIPFAQSLPGRRGKVMDATRRSCRFGGDRRCYREDWRHMPRWLPDVPVVEETGNEGGKRRERRWGCLDGGMDSGEEGNVGFDEGEEGGKEIEVVENRGKVRFKFGVARAEDSSDVGTCLRNLRCGGGIGKRVVGGGGEEGSEVERRGSESVADLRKKLG